MKRLLVIGALSVALVLALVPLAGHMAQYGFRHPDKAWAQRLVYTGATIQMWSQQYRTAVQILARAVIDFPDAPNVGRAYYRIGFCHQRMGNDEAALLWYSRFLDRWPRHVRAPQARRRVAQLETELDL